MTPRGLDRSYLGTLGSLPLYWGPGPWDDDREGDLRTRQSDLRPYRPPARGPATIDGRRVVPRPFTRRFVQDRTQMHHHLAERLLVECWCGETLVTVPRAWVRQLRTRSCGRAVCDDLRTASARRRSTR